VASNQGGIGMGYISEEIVLHLLTDMMRVATGRSDYDRFIHICPHKPSAKCACRKPGPDMLVQAYMTQNVLPENALFVGDFETDKQAAEAAGVPFMWARDFFGW
jgi:D-glycero-D-manno-heptose 1,7-bisphosphate phosphatase